MRTQSTVNSPNLMVFTDLDGSLLEPKTYSFELAKPGLRELSANNTVPVFASSKTCKEISNLQKITGLFGPLICENGAAIFDNSEIETTLIKVFGEPRVTWMADLNRLRKELDADFTGFADLSLTELINLTGLSAEAAADSLAREFSEPITWKDSREKLDQFKIKLRALNLVALEGGQFISIQSNFDKGLAMRWWISRLKKISPTIIALGDSPNDTSMLSAADIAVVIRSAKSESLEIIGPQKIIYTAKEGPEGWSEGIIKATSLINSQSQVKVEGK